jgi:histidine triad (HIT) family protein
MATVSCLFCAIVAGEIAADLVYDGPDVIAFRDITPKAPVHVLVVPRVHYAGALAGHPAAEVAVIDGIAATVAALGLDSYRTIFNTGAQAGQSVFHVHAHILAGGDLLAGFAHGGACTRLSLHTAEPAQNGGSIFNRPDAGARVRWSTS